MKCGACGYSVKVNRDKDKYYLVCSGRSNLGLCGQSIRIDLRALEASIARELERILSECPDVDTAQQADSDITGALAAIDQKIERLMSALSESSDLTMAYINRTIERLDEQRQALLAKQSQRYDRPHLSRLKFAPLEFDQKKIVAAQFINEVRLENDTATVIWKV